MKFDLGLLNNEVRLMARYKTNHRCYYCGRKFNQVNYQELDSFSVDHLVPLSKGGSLVHPDNLVPACIECNRQKNDMTLEQWRRKLGGNFKFYFEIKGVLS